MNKSLYQLYFSWVISSNYVATSVSYIDIIINLYLSTNIYLRYFQ